MSNRTKAAVAAAAICTTGCAMCDLHGATLLEAAAKGYVR
jgi:hypothetical protein